MLKRLSFTMAFLGLVALSGAALAQDTEPVNPVTMGHGPEKGSLVPAWIFYWVLGAATVICGSLVVAVRTLWNKLNTERDEEEIPGLTEDERAWLKEMHEVVTTKNADGVARVYSPNDLPGTLSKISDLSQKILEQLSCLGDSKEDRRALRNALESEKSEIRSIYTEEVKLLQERLGQEQRERREASEKLWERNNATTREVLTVIKDMIVALENATRVIEQWNESSG